MIAVDSATQLLAARERLASMLARPDVRAISTRDDDMLIVEAFVPGDQFALDGVLEEGALRVFALFEKPALAGRTVDATMYVTPARLSPSRQRVIAGHIARVALALGLHHGPIHAECRVNDDEVMVLDVAPRPIAGLCMQVIPVVSPGGNRCGLEDVLLAHALGQSLDGFGHLAVASGVLRVAVPATQIQQAVDGLDSVRVLPGVTRVEFTARPGAALEATPEGDRYPGFVFAEGAQPDDVIGSLRAASSRLRLALNDEPTS